VRIVGPVDPASGPASTPRAGSSGSEPSEPEPSSSSPAEQAEPRSSAPASTSDEPFRIVTLEDLDPADRPSGD
jgi:hypothetical protein